MIRLFGELLTKFFGKMNCSRFGQDHFAAFTAAEGLEGTLKELFLESRKLDVKKQVSIRVGIYLFTLMSWISQVGYAMFPLTDSGKEIITFQEKMHIAVTIPVVLLSIVSLILLIIAGFRKNGYRSIGIWACIALSMMFVGAIGQGAVPKEYFGIFERFSLFSAVGFHAVLGIHLFCGFQKQKLA